MRDIRAEVAMHNTLPLELPSRIVEPHRSRSSSWSWRRTNNRLRHEPRLSLQYQVLLRKDKKFKLKFAFRGGDIRSINDTPTNLHYVHRYTCCTFDSVD